MRTITPELLKELARYPRYPKAASDLVRIAGWEGAARLITEWHGQRWPVPVCPGGKTRAGIIRYQQLCELIGDAAATRIVKEWAGQRLDVPNLKEVLSVYVAQQIRIDFDRLTASGYSSPEAVFEIGLKYDVTGRWVEILLTAPDIELSAEIADSGQFSLF